jgi:hypothetical protein
MKNLISVIIISILLFSCSPANLIVTGKTHTPISPSAVVVYNSQTLPLHYEIIGRINVQSESTLGRSGAHSRNMTKLREKSAGVGGNGLIIDDPKNSHNAWGDSFMSVNATVIYVNPKDKTKSNIVKQKSTDTKSKADRLRELKQLFDEGILTQEEYDNEKKEILDEK